MHFNMHDIYDKQGQVNSSIRHCLAGHKKHVALLPNLELIDQHIHSKTVISFNESARKGLYFTLAGKQAIRSVNDVTSVQICYQPRDISGDFVMAENEQRSLLQVHISCEHLAGVLGETEEQIIQHFVAMGEKLAPESGVINLAFTHKTAKVCQDILDHSGHSISLAGHLYTLIFSLIEQLQMASHLAECPDCQGKLFQAQNLLEVPNQDAFNLAQLAKRVGLNKEALAIGFYQQVGQPIEQYCLNSRIKLAAALLREDPTAKDHVLAQSGFSEAQFEAAFVQQFGVTSQQYKQIH